MSQNFVLYRDTARSFSFPFPADWQIDDSAPEGMAMLVPCCPNEGFRANLMVTCEDHPTDVASWALESDKKLREAQPTYRVLDRRTVDVAASHGVISTYTCLTDAGTSITQLVFLGLLTDGDGLNVTASCATRDLDQYYDQFMACLTHVDLVGLEEAQS